LRPPTSHWRVHHQHSVAKNWGIAWKRHYAMCGAL
jgi:hypothetical protein